MFLFTLFERNALREYAAELPPSFEVLKIRSSQ